MSQSPPPLPPNVGDFATPPLLGYFVNWCLYGALCIQVYNYYLAFPRDRPAIKALVYVAFFLETVQTVLNAHDIYKIFGVGYGNILALTNVQLSWFALPILGGIIAAAVQIFYSYRIWVLSKSKLLAGSLVIIALAQGCSAIATGAKGFLIQSFDRLQSATRVTSCIWFIGGAVCDIAIALSLTIILLRADVSFKASQALVSKLIRLTIETGTVTATVSAVAAVFFLIPGKVSYADALTLVLARLYSNSMMVMLNSRTSFAGGRSGVASTIFMASTGTFVVSHDISVQRETIRSAADIKLTTAIGDEIAKR